MTTKWDDHVGLTDQEKVEVENLVVMERLGRYFRGLLGSRGHAPRGEFRCQVGEKRLWVVWTHRRILTWDNFDIKVTWLPRDISIEPQGTEKGERILECPICGGEGDFHWPGCPERT
jgi:hypothetical protein